MSRKLIAHVFAACALLGISGHANYYTSNESFEVASLIISLSKSIARDLAPPAQWAERIVTKAVVTEENNSRTYYIEGKDIRRGAVLGTYWLRLIKPLGANDSTIRVASDMSDSHAPPPSFGRAIPEEAQRLLGPLLNSLYDIAELNLDHRKVLISEISEPNSSPLTIQIVGVNNICIHEELNRFRLTLTHRTERNRTWYDANLEHPYWEEIPPEPEFPLPIPGDDLPLPIPRDNHGPVIP